MDGATTIAVIALAVSVLSFFLSLREASRRDEEIRYLRRESERRDEEVNLMRRQVAADEADRRREERAQMTATSGGISSATHGIEYGIAVTNAGPHLATDVAVSLEDAQGIRVGATAHAPRPLRPGGHADLAVLTPPRDQFTGPYRAFVEWNDGRGYNREDTGPRFGLP